MHLQQTVQVQVQPERPMLQVTARQERVLRLLRAPRSVWEQVEWNQLLLRKRCQWLGLVRTKAEAERARTVEEEQRCRSGWSLNQIQ